MAKLIPGAKVRVTGICKVVVDRSLEWLVPNSFELVLRSSGDLRIEKEAPWMTSGRLGLILAIALLVVFVAAGWILVLRRSVRLQTSKLSGRARWNPLGSKYAAGPQSHPRTDCQG